MAVDAQFYSQNHFSQDYMVTTNPNFSHFSSSTQNEQQKQQFFQQENIMERGFYNNNNNNFTQGINNNNNNNLYPYCSSSNTITNFNNESCLPSSMANLHPFNALLQKHTNEVDHYLHIQGERLKEAMNQQKRQQMLLLAKWYESKSMALLKEKEENLEKIRVKSESLEEYLKKAEQESVVWQNLAKEKQEMVIGLNNMLLLAQQQNNIINTNHNHYYPNNNNNNDCNYNVNNGAEEEDNYAESVSDCESTNDNSNNRSREIEEKKGEDMKKKICCKWCKNEIRNVVLLPCKHLCCCKSCEPLLGLCPICHSVKQGSIEVFFS